ncbi:MAG: gliding motility-associated C-terminal domain-containing protein, partial [Bacteroidota bacterium]
DCNARFRPAASGYLTIEIYIFNRWGQQVYFSNNAEEGWNGNMDGKPDGEGIPCQQDVYIYQINATSFSGKAYKYSGSITLLR